MVVLVVWSACGPAHQQTGSSVPTTPAASATAANSATGRQSPSESAAKCIISPRETIIVLEFEIGDTHSKPPAPQVTRQFMGEVKATPLPLSSYRGLSFDEKIIANCDAPGADGPPCMAGIGRRLNTDWLLWGAIRPMRPGYAVTAHLIRTDDLQTHRTASFTFAEVNELEPLVHAAWVQLSSPTP